VSAAGSRPSVAAERAVSPVRAGRAPRLFAAGAVVALALTGCSAGIQAETSRERPTIDGIGSAIGTLTIRNAYVGGPAEPGGEAPVLLSVFNNGTQPDRLVSISSPDAGAGTVPTDVTLPPGGQQLLYTADRAARLTGLTQPAQVGSIVPVVLTFERAGQLRLSLPVSPVPPEVLSGDAASATPSASPAPTGAPSDQPSAAAAASASASPYSGITPAP
jgi:copper(I)-binding protein